MLGADKHRFWLSAGFDAAKRAELEQLAGVELAPLLRYWVIKLHDAVVGTTGLYSLKEDYPDAVWVGWFCLENTPEVRGHGYGKAMIAFTIEQARAAGARIVKLYTSDMSEESTTQHVYQKAGLVVVGEEPRPVYG